MNKVLNWEFPVNQANKIILVWKGQPMWPIHTLSTFRLSLKDYQTSKENQRSEENLQRENGHQNKGIEKKKQFDGTEIT